jgi:hypothetical protein
MTNRSSTLSVLAASFVLGCGAEATPDRASPSPSASPAAEAPAPSTPPPAPVLAEGPRAACALEGPALEIDVPCEGALHVGPFALEREGETVVLGTQHEAALQTCPAASWVDASDAFVETAGIGCSEQGQPATAEISYRYAPGEGGSSATPVFLRLARGDVGPEACVPLHLRLTRAR